MYVRNIRWTFLFCVFSLLVATAQPTIILDDKYSDWDAEDIYMDENDHNDGLDIRFVEFSDSPERLCFRLQLEPGFEVKIYDTNYQPDDLILYIDTDKNESTGKSIHGLGAELEMRFGDRFFYFHSPFVSSWERYYDDIGFKIAPTTTGSNCEMCFDKNAEIDGSKIFPENSFDFILACESGDLAPNTPATYAFNNENWTHESISLSKFADHTLRVISQNTLNESLEYSETHNSYERVFSTLDPDFIILNESNISTAYVEDLLDSWMPEKTWTVIKQNSRTMIASSYPILEAEYVSYRITGVLVDLPDDNFDGDLVLIGMHAPCCENDGDRQIEADRFARYMIDLKEGNTNIQIDERTAIVAAGDLNLVGYRQQLETFLTGDIQNTDIFGDAVSGLDWDDTPLEMSSARHTEQANYHTWDGSFSSWPDSKLDYIMFTDSNIDLKKSFVVNTGAMSTESLQEYGLQYYDSSVMSDHYTIVADIHLNSNTIVSTEEPKSSLAIHMDQATKDQILISAKSEANELINVQILDLKGKVIFKTKWDSTDALEVNLHGWMQGMYVVHFSHPKINLAERFVKY